jgi:hypothetical protein
VTGTAPGPRVVARAVALTLLVGAVGFGPSVPATAATDATAWGATFCTETVGWLQGAIEGADELAARAEDPSLTPAQGRALVVRYLQGGVRATRAFGKAVKQAGAPDVPNGTRIQAAILAGIAGSEARLTALARTARTLPTKSPAVFDRAVSKLSTKLSSFSNPFQKGMARAQDLDRDRALGSLLETLPECAALAAGPPG